MMEKISTVLLTIYTLAHALVVLSLAAFGLRADGWVLHPVAVAWYGLFVLGGFALLVRSWRVEAHYWLPVIPPMLALVAVGTFPSTSALGGAAYAGYDLGEIHDQFVALNLAAALGMTALALLYDRSRLFLTFAAVQASLLLTYPAWWAGLWHWGGLPMLALVGGPPVLYALAAWALGKRPPRRWGWSVLVGLAAGVGLVALAESQWGLISRPMRLALWKAPVYLAFGAMLAPVPLLSCQMLRGQPREKKQRSTWEVLALLLLTFTSLALRFVQPGSHTPLLAAGAVQDWRSSDHVVPGAWLPTITWAGWLLRAVRWLLIPYALLGAVSLLRDVRPRLTAPAHPGSLMWAGLVWIAAFAWDVSRLGFPLRVVRGGPSAISAYPVVLGGIVLLLVARAAERKRGVWARWLWRWIALAALALMLVWVGRAGWDYGRALVAPLPAWADRWQYGALPRIPLTALGLTAHLVAGGLGLFALGNMLRAWRERTRTTRRLLPVVVPLLALVGVAGLWWWITAPRVVRTVPPNGATDVPRDTVIRIEMKEREWLGRVLGHSGQGLRARYTDTGERILGRTSGSTAGVHFAPAGPLRPHAPVAVTVHRTGERPYTLRFITAGEDDSTAVPKLASTRLFHQDIHSNFVTKSQSRSSYIVRGK